MNQRFLDRTAPPHNITLIMMASTGAMAMSVFLPSLPGMARYFDADYRVVQLAVPVYLAATAVFQLAIGPFSDRFGRRPIALACLGVFVLATIAAIFAPTIEFLLVCRVFQAFAAGGMVLARAVVRDTVDRIEDAASRIGYVTMGMSLMPMVAPMIGGVLDELYGWKATFMITLVLGAGAFLLVLFDLGETHRNKSANMLVQIRTYPELLRSNRFWGYTMTAGFGSGAFFAFLGGGPYVATEILGMSPSRYGLYFAGVSGGYMVGNYISGRFSQRIGVNRMMLVGNFIATAGISVSLLLFLAGFQHPVSLFVPILFTGLGNGLTLPNASAGQVSVRPHLAGSASGLGATMQISIGALLATAAGALLTPNSGPYPLLLVMLLSSLCAIASTLHLIYSAGRTKERS